MCPKIMFVVKESVGVIYFQNARAGMLFSVYNSLLFD
jgi:hypothetical protein